METPEILGLFKGNSQNPKPQTKRNSSSTNDEKWFDLTSIWKSGVPRAVDVCKMSDEREESRMTFEKLGE